MATVHQTWDPAAITSLLTTEMNALGANSGCNLSTAYDNATNCFMWALFELTCTYGSAPAADTTVDLFLVPAPDGTNYDDGSSTVFAQNHVVGSYNIRAVTTAQLLSLWGVPLPPTKFKVNVYNNTGQNMAATGNTLKMIPYGLKAA
jgi:hypothetical protein